MLLGVKKFPFSISLWPLDSRHTDKGWFAVSSLSNQGTWHVPWDIQFTDSDGNFYLLPVYSSITCIASLINVPSFQIDSPKLGFKLILQAQGHKEQETNFVLSLRFPLLLFSCEVVTSSLWSHGLQHARLLCPPLSPRVCSNSCPLRQWCYLTISSSAPPFSFCLQSFPVSQLLASDG